MSDIHLNQRSLAIASRLIADADGLGVSVEKLPGGATVIDAGVAAAGSLEAGRLMAEICLGGLGQVDFSEINYCETTLQGIQVAVSRPVLACMASQYAGWAISRSKTDPGGPFFAMGSGPARILARKEALFNGIGHSEPATCAVLALEGRQLPNQEVAAFIAETCGVAPSALYLIIAPTASLAGSTQVAARVVETGMHKLHELGFDLSAVLSGFGACPVAPVAQNDLRAIGRTNDAVLYGGRAWFTVDCEDEDLERVLEKIPSQASRDYGTLFYDLFMRYEGDFYKIDPLLFSPAQVFFANSRTGRSFSAGETNLELLRKSFDL